MAFDPTFLQYPVDLEPVETCLLDNDDSEVLSCSLLRLRPQLGKTLEEPSDIAGADRSRHGDRQYLSTEITRELARRVWTFVDHYLRLRLGGLSTRLSTPRSAKPDAFRPFPKGL